MLSQESRHEVGGRLPDARVKPRIHMGVLGPEPDQAYSTVNLVQTLPFPGTPDGLTPSAGKVDRAQVRSSGVAASPVSLPIALLCLSSTYSGGVSQGVLFPVI